VDRELELVICSGITLILFNFKHVGMQAPTSFAKNNILPICLPVCIRVIRRVVKYSDVLFVTASIYMVWSFMQPVKNIILSILNILFVTITV